MEALIVVDEVSAVTAKPVAALAAVLVGLAFHAEADLVANSLERGMYLHGPEFI